MFRGLAYHAFLAVSGLCCYFETLSFPYIESELETCLMPLPMIVEARLDVKV